MNYNEILKSAFDVYFNTPLEAWDQFVEFSEFVSYEKFLVRFYQAIL